MQSFGHAGRHHASRGLAAVLALTVLATAPRASSEPANFPTTLPVQFVLVGDTGTGTPGQYAVAAAMATVCAERGCQFAIGLGDNIYEYGPDSVDDRQFRDKFEKPYAKLAFPFFMVLGNHDQSGIIPGSGVHPARGDHEVAYTRLSAKWMMPARYYRFSAPFASATDWKTQVAHPVIEFFAIDSNYLAPQNYPQHDWYRPGRPYDLDQRDWLRAGLAASRASWKVVFAHHPLLNNGKDHNAGEFLGFGLSKGVELKRLYEEEVCGKADLLVSGHDHSLQWMPPQTRCGARTHFVISGAGAKLYERSAPDKEANRTYFEAFGTLGFFWANVSADSLTLAAYTVDAKGVPTLAYENTIRK
jgi:tartrate-resistant acid phosphatase type 5